MGILIADFKRTHEKGVSKLHRTLCASSASHNMTCSNSTRLTDPEGVVLLSFSELLLQHKLSTSKRAMDLENGMNKECHSTATIGQNYCASSIKSIPLPASLPAGQTHLPPSAWRSLRMSLSGQSHAQRVQRARNYGRGLPHIPPQQPSSTWKTVPMETE
jgi:hypothetical protein